MSFKLKNYNEYFENISLLKEDVSALENLHLKNPSDDSSKLLNNLKKLEKDLLIIKNPQSISIFIDKAKSLQWKNVEKRSIDLKSKCENGQLPIQICSDAIVDLQSFVLQSNLSDKYIDSVIGELEYYKMQQEKIASYGNEYQNSFNQSINNFNDKIFKSENNTTLTTVKNNKMKALSFSKEKEFNHVKNVKPVLNEFNNVLGKEANDLIAYISVSLLILMVLNKLFKTIFKKIQSSQLKNQYFKVLSAIQKAARVKVRSFGNVDNKTITHFSNHFSILEKTFSQKKKFNGELHFIY